MAPLAEEQHPLLLLFLEDGNGSPRKRGRCLIDNKYHRIKERSGKILTRWSAPVTCSFCLFLFICLLYGVLLPLIYSMQTDPNTTPPQCISYTIKQTKIYLMHHGKWHNIEIDSIKEIINKYPNIQIEIVSLRNKSHSTTRSVEKVKKSKFDKLLLKYPIISIRNEIMADYFQLTPLYKTWMNMNYDLVEFAARSILLWEFGGISFTLPKRKYFHGIKVYSDPMKNDNIKTNMSYFNALSNTVVNIDEDGCEMETKITCHRFFSEIIKKLQGANLNTTAKRVITETLQQFCRSGEIQDSYCLTILGS